MSGSINPIFDARGGFISAPIAASMIFTEARILGTTPRSPIMKKLVLETTAPFQGLPELVAHQEGLFAKEGLQIEWVDRESEDKKRAEVNVLSPKGLDPFSS